jgi:gluconate 2-dehydrogenase gamma chain
MRGFLKAGAGVVAGAGGILILPPQSVDGATSKAPQRQRDLRRPAENRKLVHTFFNPTEAAFAVTAMDVLIPKDALSPSASHCGISVCMDRQMNSAWGQGDRMYLQGPWKEGAVSQCYQLPLSPAELQ